MKNLLDPDGDYMQTEKNVKQYLKTLPDQELSTLYGNIVLTSFPILLSKEYKKRKSDSKNKRKSKKSEFKKMSLII